MKRKSSCRPEGFTLAEMLIATGIVVFLVVMLGQILSTTQGMWRKSEARADPFRDARAALELMARDLSLVITNDKAPVLALQNIYSQGNDSTDGPSHNRQAYGLLPTQNTEKTDVCAVGYYCTWDKSKGAYILRRHFIASDFTYSRLQNAGLPSSPGPVNASSIFIPSSPANSPAQDEDIAAYVWDLKVIPYEYNAGSLTANNTYPITYNGTLPQFLEISFKAISPQAALRVAAMNMGTGIWFDTTNMRYKNTILPDMQQFSTRIRLYNAAKP